MRTGIAIAACLAILLTVVAPTSAQYRRDGAAGRHHHDVETHIAPEILRLQRHAYDYTYRNSNNNVFRSSRHAHPTNNPFRSSRHYQRKLAAANDGYPLRTFVHSSHRSGHRNSHRIGHGHTGGLRGNRFHEDVYSYAHHQGRFTPVEIDTAPRPLQDRPPRSRDRDVQHDNQIAILQQVVHEAEARPATHRPVLHQITDENGVTRTVISSVPLTAESNELRSAWDALEDGEHEAAATAFAQSLFDKETAPAATAGYALALAMGGDTDGAKAAMRRALELDADVVETLELSDELRVLIGALVRRIESSDRGQPVR